jgi:hypothetical protein
MIKKGLFVILFLLVVIFISCRDKSLANKVEIEENIRSAVELFQAAPARVVEGQKNPAEKGFKLLMEAITLILPDSDFPDEVKEKILLAHQKFQTVPHIFKQSEERDAALKLLLEARHLLKPQREMSAAPFKIAENVKKHLDSALAHLESADPHLTALSTLDALLLIFPTPTN